ncbi:MAG: hypothetical protein WB543_08165 [Candidatus Acidiferrum sp.]
MRFVVQMLNPKPLGLVREAAQLQLNFADGEKIEDEFGVAAIGRGKAEGEG